MTRAEGPRSKSEIRPVQIKQRKRKAPRTAWKKGQSGNPGGRPREVAEVKALARQHSEEAIRTIVELMRTAEHERTRLAAASELLDRGFGRPAMALDLGGPVQIFGYAAHRLAELNDEELRKLDEITRRIAEPIGD